MVNTHSQWSWVVNAPILSGLILGYLRTIQYLMDVRRAMVESAPAAAAAAAAAGGGGGGQWLVHLAHYFASSDDSNISQQTTIP